VTAASASSRLLLGRIAGAHGIRGEVLIHTYTAAPEDIGAYGPLSDATAKRNFDIEIVRATPKGVVARIAGVADRNAAEGLKGVELYVPRDRLPAAAEGEFYHADLIGLAAVGPDGKPIGEIVAVQNYGAGDLLEIRLAGSGKTELLPFTEAVVPDIDMAARRAVVILPAATDARDDASSET
jgi:16S rRNA processing protein RimM